MADLDITVDYTDLKMFNEYLNRTTANVTAKVKQASGSFDEFKRSKMEVDRLRGSIDPLYAATARYEREVETLSRAVKNNAITTSQQKSILNQLNTAYGVAEGKVTRLGVASQLTGRKMSRGSMVAQQFGYQIGDFFVQVQSGQSALIAFAQQGTQLAGLLPGITGAVIGIGLAASTMAAGFFRSRRGAKDLSDVMDDLTSSVSAYETAVNNANTSLLETIQNYGDAYEAAKTLFDLQVDMARVDATRNLSDAVNGVTESFGDLSTVSQESFDMILDKSRFISEAYAEMREAESAGNYERQRELTEQVIALGQLPSLVNDVASAYNTSAQEAQDLLIAVRAFQDAEGFTEQANAAADLAQEIYDATDGLEDADAETVSLYRNLLDAGAEAANLASIDVASNISAAADQGARLATNLSTAVDLFAAMSAANASSSLWDSVSNYESSGRGGDPRQFGTDYGSVFNQPGDSGSVFPQSMLPPGVRPQARSGIDFGVPAPGSSVGSSSSGSGGSERDAVAERLENLREQLDLQQALIGKTETQVELINALGIGYEEVYGADTINALTQQIDLINQMNETLERQQEVSDVITNSMSSAFESMADGTKSVSEAFRDMAREIIIELNKVLFIQNLVGDFSASTGEGSGLAGLIGGLLFRESGGSMTAGQPYMVGERGPELVVPRHSGTVVNAQQTAAMGKQQVELIIHSDAGVDIETVRQEVGVQITRAAPSMVNASVKASQKNLRTGSKTMWGL